MSNCFLVQIRNFSGRHVNGVALTRAIIFRPELDFATYETKTYFVTEFGRKLYEAISSKI